MSKQPNALITEAIEVLSLLASEFPDAFKHEDQEPVPLSVGIREQVKGKLDGLVGDDVLSRALGTYCRRFPYLESLARPGAVRVGLDGQPTEMVSAEHQELSRQIVDKIRAKAKKSNTQGVGLKVIP